MNGLSLDGLVPRVRILHIFPSFVPGGSQSRFVALANSFGAEFSHTVCALDNRFEAASRLNRDVVYTAMPGPSYKETLRVARLFYKRVRELRPDLVITYNWGAIDGLLGCLCAQVCPIIHIEDGFGPDEVNALKRRRALARRVLLNRIQQTIVPSETLLQIAKQRFGIQEVKLRYIANGVDIDQFIPGRLLERRQELGLDPLQTLFGFLGQLRPEKNLSLLLGAFAEANLPNASLLLLGEGASEGALKELVRNLGIKERVIFQGLVQDPVRYLQSLDVFVMSSATEQMPMSLLEAMACALPAVCTEVGDTAEMLGAEASSFVIPPGHVSGFAGALRTLANDENLRRRLGAENRTRCVERYSLNRMVSQHRETYLTAVQAWREARRSGH